MLHVCCSAQTSILFRPVTTNPPNQSRDVLTKGDAGVDPSLYSPTHDVLKGPAGTIFAFQNGLWHRALPVASGGPRTIAYFQYCPTMLHPLHRPAIYESDPSLFTSEQLWLLGEARPFVPGSGNRFTYGSPEDKVRMDRFRRSDDDPYANYYVHQLANHHATRAL